MYPWEHEWDQAGRHDRRDDRLAETYRNPWPNAPDPRGYGHGQEELYRDDRQLQYERELQFVRDQDKLAREAASDKAAPDVSSGAEQAQDVRQDREKALELGRAEHDAWLAAIERRRRLPLMGIDELVQFYEGNLVEGETHRLPTFRNRQVAEALTRAKVPTQICHVRKPLIGPRRKRRGWFINRVHSRDDPDSRSAMTSFSDRFLEPDGSVYLYTGAWMFGGERGTLSKEAEPDGEMSVRDIERIAADTRPPRRPRSPR